METLERKVLAWLASRDTGVSSKVLAFASVGLTEKLDDLCYPWDASDLGRCIRLVESIPEVRLTFPVVCRISNKWCNIIDHWDELVELYNHEHASDDKNIVMRMPETRALLKKLIGDDCTISA